MKKLLPVLLAAGMILSMFVLPASAEAGSDGKTEVVKTETPPTIDGDIDEMWEFANEVYVAKFGSNIFPATSTEKAHRKNPVATAKVRFMWDKTHIYALARVFDRTPNGSASKANPEDCDIDSVDFQISENNDENASMRDDTVGKDNKLPGNGIFNVNINGKVTGWGGVWFADNGSGKVVGAAKKTDYGYILEIAIPLQTMTATEGDIIGMEIQINDNQNGTGRTAIRQWSCDECLGHSNTKYLGKLDLAKASTTKVPFEDETDIQTETEPVSTKKPETSPKNTDKPNSTSAPAGTSAPGDTSGKTTGTVPADRDSNAGVIAAVAVIAVAVIAVVAVIIVKKNREKTE